MHVSLRRVNNLILALIVIINLYIIGAPLLPTIVFWWQNGHTDRKQVLSAQIRVTKPAPPPKDQPNHIVVPSMLLDTPVLESPMKTIENTLNQGIVRIPASSTPDKGGNTVFVGHRFSYTAPKGIFYYLNKLKPGDEMGVWWASKEYIYKVVSTNEVDPTDTAVEAPTNDARLTLYTCTPLWNPKNRLVVVAEQETKP